MLLIICNIICSCSKKMNTGLIFPLKIELTESNLTINKDSLAQVEGMQCYDSLLIVWDFHTGQSFTLFNIHTRDCYGRFGTIGQDPTDIPLEYGGYISQDKYKIFNRVIGFIAQFDIDSLCRNINNPPYVLYRKVFTDDIFFSAIIPIYHII